MRYPGRYVGATLDRNGLRPCRYYTTTEGLLICASEVGALAVDPATITSKGRLEPGKMLLVDTQRGRMVGDEEIKTSIASRRRAGGLRMVHVLGMGPLLYSSPAHTHAHAHPADQYPFQE